MSAKQKNRRKNKSYAGDDVSFVIRSYKQILQTLREGLADCDIPEPNDEVEIVRFYQRYFESEAAFHRLRDIRYQKNAIVHRFGYDRVRDLHPANRINSRRQFEDAYAFVRREIDKAVENLKRDYLPEETEEEVVEEDWYVPEPIVETLPQGPRSEWVQPIKLAVAAGIVLALVGLFVGSLKQGQGETDSANQASSIPVQSP